MNDSALTVGIVGCGEIAQIMHIPNFVHDARWRVECVADIDATLAAQVASRWGIPKSYRGLAAMLTQERHLDVVAIITSGNHSRLVIDALTSGSHVFVEKPMCYSVDEARGIRETATHLNKIVMVGYTRLFDAGFMAWQEAARAVGPRRLLVVTSVFPPDRIYGAHHDVIRPRMFEEPSTKRLMTNSWEQFKSELIFDLAIHDLYSIRDTVGSRPSVRWASETGDKAGFTAALTAEGGWDIAITATMTERLGGGLREEMTAVGDLSTVRVQIPSVYERGRQSVSELSVTGGEHLETKQFVPYPADPFKAELQHFYDCVREGAKCICGPDAALSDSILANELASIVRAPIGSKPL